MMHVLKFYIHAFDLVLIYCILLPDGLWDGLQIEDL